MRKRFIELLDSEMSKNEKIFVIIGDVGFGFFDDIIKKEDLQFLHLYTYFLL